MTLEGLLKTFLKGNEMNRRQMMVASAAGVVGVGTTKGASEQQINPEGLPTVPKKSKEIYGYVTLLKL
jgi:hypothetical protein